MDSVDRITIYLLNNYTFVFHEDVSNIANEENEVVRKFVEEYLKKIINGKIMIQIFLFVNTQRFNAIIDNYVDQVKKICITRYST